MDAEERGEDGLIRRLAILLILDIGVILGGLFFRSLLVLSAYLHFPIAIWMGVTIAQTAVPRWIVAAYSISVIIPALSLLAPGVVYPLAFLFPFGISATGIAVQWVITIGILGKKFTRGRWPLPVSMVVTLVSLVFVVSNLSFKTTEFGPLAMLFVNIFSSPVLLGLPFFLRIPAADDIKPYLSRLHYATGVLVGLAWIIFGVRSFGIL